MAEGNVHRVDFYPAAQGFDPQQPSRSQMPGGGLPIWRSLLNMRPHDGVLKVREAARSTGLAAPPFTSNTAAWSQSPVLIAPLPGVTANSAPRLLIVGKDILLYDGLTFTWRNLTPILTGEGTVSSSGTAVTGVGTLWLTRRIAVGQWMQIPAGSGSFHRIVAVSSQTSITLATSPGTFSGVNYVIRRTFEPGEPDPAFARVLNGDVYLAGILGRGSDPSGVVIPDGAVLRLVSAADNLVPVSTLAPAQYLTAGNGQLTAGLDLLGYLNRPVGFDILEDGRLILPLHWFDTAGPFGGGTRVAYSSPLNPAVWSSSPGGHVDLIGNRGRMTAAGRIGRSMVFYFLDQARLGEPTGLLDPPLSFPATRAAVGPVSAMAVGSTPLGEMYVGADLHLYTFDGDRERRVQGAYFREALRANMVLGTDFHANTFSMVSLSREEYSFFFRVTFGTYELRWCWSKQQMTLHHYRRIITAAAPPLDQKPLSSLSETNIRALLGTDSFADAATEMVYVLRDDQVQDVWPFTSGDTYRGYLAETGDLDFGMPNTKKVLERVEVWMRGGLFVGPEGVRLEVALNGGSGVSMTVDATPSLGASQERLATFFFDEQPAELFRFRLKQVGTDDAWQVQIVFMTVFFAPVADGRADP